MGADGNLAAGTASKLEIDLTADDDGAQYYCHVGYNDVGLDTGVTLVNIATEETAPIPLAESPLNRKPGWPVFWLPRFCFVDMFD